MDKSIEAQPMYLGDMGEDDFMFIYVDTGKMPPNRVSNYLEKVKDSLKLCQMLEDRGINYSLVACRRDAKPLVKPIEVERINIRQGELELVPVEDSQKNLGNKFDRALKDFE